jgi:uncharacterized protein with PQ loop repeat
MHPSLIDNALIVVGEGFWVFSGTAQLRKLVRTSNAKGLSAPSQTLNAAGNVGWCTYFGLNHLWYPFITNIILFFVTIVILGYTLSNRKQFIRGLITIVIVGPLTSYALIRYTVESGWLAMAYNEIASMPQLVKVVYRKRVSGISERGLFFATGAMILTLTYAFLIHSRPLMTGCALGLINVVVLFIYYYRHRHHG